MIAPANLQGQRHIIQSQNGELIVVTGQACSLEFWTLDQGGNPANLNDLVFLENFFAFVRTTQYQGENIHLSFDFL